MEKNCELCAFKNPKCSATAVIIKNNAVLLLKRNQEPFKGMWDFPGGYTNEGERPIETIKREVTEELGVIPWSCRYLEVFPSIGFREEERFPVNDFYYLVDIGSYPITLNDENSEYKWMPIKELDPKELAFPGGSACTLWLKQNFTFDVERIRDLIFQLDPSARFEEQNLYRAAIEGFVYQQYIEGKLIGIGWIFPRQTMLRKQAVVEDMIVDKEYRGFGYGKLILDQLVKWAAKEGVEMIELTSNPARVAANALYKKYGFQLHHTNHYLLKI